MLNMFFYTIFVWFVDFAVKTTAVCFKWLMVTTVIFQLTKWRF